MNYRKLQKTDLEISEISFGCMSLDLSGKNNEKILQNAFDQGINYFETFINNAIQLARESLAAGWSRLQKLVS